MKTAVFVYKTEQVAKLPELLATIDGEYDVITCGADIEFLLEEKGIEYHSAQKFRTLATKDRFMLAKELGEQVLNNDASQFFSYHEIHLGRLATFALQDYLGPFLYSIDMIISALEEPYDRVLLYIPVFNKTSIFGGLLSGPRSQIFPDAIRMVCKKQNIKLDIFVTSVLQDGFFGQFKQRVFMSKRMMFGFLMRVLNIGVRVFVSKKKIRILASELWKNIEPLMYELPECELMLLDRKESVVIGLRGIIKNRMQFMHSDDFVTRSMSHKAHAVSVEFLQKWESIKSEHVGLHQVMFRGYALEPVLRRAIQDIFESSEKMMLDIEGTWAMMKALEPDVVIVRASISAQTHFAILCEVARLQGIPSLEIQHGMLSVAPEGSISNRTAQYIAEYGPFDRNLWREHAYAPNSELIDIGSPRFDAYIAMGHSHKEKSDVFEILYIAPEVSIVGFSDSYDVFEYFENIASAVREIPQVHVTVKLRPGRANESFYREALQRTFKDISYSVAIFESLVDLLPKADVVVSSYSTVLLEALLSGCPVIFDASLPIYASAAHFDLTKHREAGVLIITETAGELTEALKELAYNPTKRHEISERASRFMKENYLFHDGKSSQRLANAIRNLAKNKKSQQADFQNSCHKSTL